MRGKDYWNVINQNAYCVAAVLVLHSLINRIFHFFCVIASETPIIYPMFGCKFTTGDEKCYHPFPKDVIPTNIWLKKAQRSDGVNPNTARMCSLYFSYPLKYTVFILFTP